MPARTRPEGLLTLVRLGPLGHLTDGQLLERFATRSPEEAEVAFEILVERYGPMVLRTCRAILREDHEAMDAFQATFLVLLHKGRTLRVRDSLGPWLHRVACRAAAKARAQGTRRRLLEQRAADLPRANRGGEVRDERAAALHEELDRLPERLRVPIVLCDLEGRTCEEAALLLGKSVRTIKNWRARGRDRLRDRLTRRGLDSTHASLFPHSFTATPSLIEALVRVEVRRATVGATPAPATTLAKGVLTSMLLTKFKAAVTTLGLVAGVAGVLYASQIPAGGPDGGREAIQQAHRERPTPIPEPHPGFRGDEDRRGIWTMTLDEAIRLGLAHRGDVRIAAGPSNPGGPVRISPIGAAADRDRTAFKADLMRHVRSIEQQFWELHRTQNLLSSRETAVSLGLETLKREQARWKGTIQEAGPELQTGEWVVENFRLKVVAATSELINAERQLRTALGLPASDNRRIYATGTPSIPRTDGRWEEELAKVVGNPSPPVDSAAIVLDASNKFKSYRTAARVRGAADQRLAAQSPFYDEGKITADRMFDAIGQAADAAAQEEIYLADYNRCRTGLEQHQGTLLQRRGLIEGPATRPTSVQEPDQNQVTSPQTGSTDQPAHIPKMEVGLGKTVSFHFSLGLGRTPPLEIRGTFSVTPAGQTSDVTK